jgi:hypothetical protein
MGHLRDDVLSKPTASCGVPCCIRVGARFPRPKIAHTITMGAETAPLRDVPLFAAREDVHRARAGSEIVGNLVNLKKTA